MTALRVFLVDDHDIVRAGLRALLEREPGIEITGEAASAEEAIAILTEREADVVILDYRLPGMDGASFCREIAERRMPFKTIMLSAHLDDEAVQRSFLAGAKGFVVKDVQLSELRRAIRAVARGGSYVDPKVAGRIMGWAARLERPAPDALRPKELEILRHLAAGHSNAEIAELVLLSRNRVAARLVVIFQKLGVKSRAEAVAVALRKGLVASQGRADR
jgi:DNA-binding NarL/FixJ family response regulator